MTICLRCESDFLQVISVLIARGGHEFAIGETADLRFLFPYVSVQPARLCVDSDFAARLCSTG